MKILYAVIILFIAPAQAFAYLDPGTGSILIQGLVAAFAAASLFFSNVRHWFIDKLSFRKKDEEREKDVLSPDKGESD